MSAEKEGLFTAASMAKQLGVSDAKVKKAIKEPAIEPKTKKGACSCYTPDALAGIGAALK